MLTAIFIVALVILITLLALAYMFYTFSNNFTKLRRERCEVFSLAYESPRIINISKNYTQKIQKS